MSSRRESVGEVERKEEGRGRTDVKGSKGAKGKGEKEAKRN